VEFVHGDIRTVDDLADLGKVVHTPSCSVPANCLEYAWQHGSDFVFLSTSRVYSIDAACTLPLDSNDNRFALRNGVQQLGVSPAGISESFPVNGHRSLSGGKCAMNGSGKARSTGDFKS
jgi:CDP-paratose 2-epimerase